MDIKKGLQEATDILALMMKDELTTAEKDKIVEDSIYNFNTHVNPGFLEYRKAVSTNAAYIEWTDSGETITDLYGTEFIDCLGGYGIYNVGHRHPEVIKHLKKQLDRQALHSQELVDPLRGYLAKTVANISPGDLQYAFFTNGGAEAVEMSLKLSRLATGKRYFISTVNGFHGKSFGAVSMTGKATYRKPYLPMIQQVQHVEFGNADAVETAIENLVAVGESVAAVIVEPVQGEAGIVIPPKGYLKRLREICDKHEVVLIFDEIQTGMGRTGKLWACQHEDVVPDILIFGKGFGGGAMPITGYVARPHLYVEELLENPMMVGSPTFGGNPMACTAALATIKVTLEEDLPAQVAEKGEYLIGKLKEIQKKHSKLLVDVRGIGMLIGLQFANSDIGYSVSKGMFSRGILVAGTLNNAEVIRIEPPLIQSIETMDIVIQKLDEALTDAEKEHEGTY